MMHLQQHQHGIIVILLFLTILKVSALGIGHHTPSSSSVHPHAVSSSSSSSSSAISSSSLSPLGRRRGRRRGRMMAMIKMSDRGRGGGLMQRILRTRGGGGGSRIMEEEEEEGGSGRRNKTAEWEAGASWLTNQVLLYQTHLSLSSEALGKRRAVVGPTAFDLGLDNDANKPPLEIAKATETEMYECRIHGEVEPGSKVVAPCQCRGTAKWMWFADMNRRRRRDPIASRTCGTCHAVIDYGAYQKFGSALCKAVSWPLDHKIAFRFIIGLGAFFSSLILALPASVVVIRILTSGLFWRAHGLWSRVVYGPLPLKVVLYQYIARYIWTRFLQLESWIREVLADWESDFLEKSLPVTYHTPSSSS